MYNSGKIQLTIEKFKRISGHQMSASSSSLAAFLAWTCNLLVDIEKSITK
jgi:hypothetical protein